MVLDRTSELIRHNSENDTTFLKRLMREVSNIKFIK
jgi:hypothetical protein